MARDLPVRDPDGPSQTTDSDEEQHPAARSERGTIDRRSYLKLASATAVAAGLGAAGASASTEDYEVIEARGQTIRIDSGETWENKLIDLGYRNRITIVAKGTNWTIRNIGFIGTLATGTAPNSETLFGVCDSGNGTSTMENIHFGEGGADRSSSDRPIQIWVDPSHSGHLDVKCVNFARRGANGIYGSAPGYNGNGGTVALDNCYAYDSHHTAFRISDNGSSVTNCVSYKTGTRAAARGIWVWEGNYSGGATISDTHLITNGTGASLDTYNNPRVITDGLRTDNGGGDGNDPRHFVPEGCPESPEEAASGGSGDSSSPPSAELPDNTVTITGAGEPTKYYLETAGDLVGNPDRGSLEVHDVTDGTSATGWVTTTSNVDSFRFDGDLLDVGFEQGSATVELNGEEIDPDTFGDESLENTLLVDGVGTSGGTRYEFSVSGAAEKSTASGASIDDEDTIDSGHVTGTVAGWRDAFQFSGELEDLTVDGGARIYVNDERVDPADYGDEQPHVLTLVGNGTDANYEISVDGTITAVSGDDAEQYATATSENTVEGSIVRGVQRFRFSGAITDVTFLDGSAHVYVDDERIDPDEYGEQELLPNAIVIDGTDTDGETAYTFSIDGEVITSSYRDASIDSDDEIDGTSVTGSVDEEIDAYWFDGDITDFRLSGQASVDVEHNVRSE